MSYYAITFRVANKTANGKSYDQRRQSIIDGARASGEMGYWDETTSFILVESTMSTGAIAQSSSQSLSAKDDMLVAFDPEDMSAYYFGALDSVEVLKSFFPKLKKVP